MEQDPTFNGVLPAAQAPIESVSAPRPTLAELFATYVRFVWRVVAAQGIRANDVEDVTQEVFITAHRRMEDWDPARASARTWLYAIAIRTAANHRRRAHHRREEAREVERASEDDPGEAIDHARALARLYKVLEQLEPDKRSVFVLYDLQEMPMKEVAQTLGCPVKTAYTRLYAARAQVMAALGAGEGGT